MEISPREVEFEISNLKFEISNRELDFEIAQR
jgi:hypothetical protein